MGVKIWVNKGHIYLSLCYGGKQWREGTGLTIPKTKTLEKEVMKAAEALRCKREIEMATSKAGMMPPEERGLSLYEYAEKKGLIHHVLAYLDKYGARKIAMRSLSRRWCEAFQAAVEQDEKLSKTSAENYCIQLRSLLHKAVRDGWWDKSPYDGVPHIKAESRPRLALTAEEVRRLDATPCPGGHADEIRRAFFFSCLTGLRVSDMMTLRQADIDREAMLMIKRQVKTGGVVYIPLSAQALELAGTDDPPFPYLGTKAGQIKTNVVLRKWGEAAGLSKPVTWHIARHTAATLLLEAGADVYTVQHILGHSKLSTTEIYAEVQGGTKRRAMEALAGLLKNPQKS